MNSVVLVHGIWDSSKRMRSLAEDLEKCGKKVFLIDLFPSDGRLGIREMAIQLRSFVENNCLEKFDIVAFSMGGIVSKYYIAELGGAAHVSSFITISTPHHGTLMGFIYPFILGRELRLGSVILQSLETKMKHLSIRALSLWTPFDLIIFPAKSSVISWGKNEAFNVLLHPWMMQDYRVRKRVCDFLNN